MDTDPRDGGQPTAGEASAPESGTPVPVDTDAETAADARLGLPRQRRTPHPVTAGMGGRRSRARDRDTGPEPQVDPVALALARRIVDLAADKKAGDVVLLDVHALTSITDYFVICSGASDRQLRAIADGISDGLKVEGVRPIGREGDAGTRWLLLDFGSVIVHVMSGPEREYYGLEKLWSEAPLLLRVL